MGTAVSHCRTAQPNEKDQRTPMLVFLLFSETGQVFEGEISSAK